MNPYATSATVENNGQIRLAGIPFAPGTHVEVIINPKRKSAEEFTEAWKRVCAELRLGPGAGVSDDEIAKEVENYRAGQ